MFEDKIRKCQGLFVSFDGLFGGDEFIFDEKFFVEKRLSDFLDAFLHNGLKLLF